MKKIIKFLLFAGACCLTLLLIIMPEICQKNIANAIVLCGRVLIPSLFPFNVCVLFIIKSGLFSRLEALSPITERLLGLSVYPAALAMFSAIGGYPVGAQLINEAVKSGRLSQKDGRKMLNFCVNAGAGFIVSAVGLGLLKQKTLGYILLCAHLTAPLIILSLSRINGKIKALPQKREAFCVTDTFVAACAQGANAIISVCGFVILFSVITAYLEYYSQYLKFLKPLYFLSEVTLGISKTQNIYVISFLLGFAGFCIWCQILAVGKNIKIRLLSFGAMRILHGLLSAGITYLLLKLFPVTQPVFSNITNIKRITSVSTASLSVSIIIMAIIFVISLTSKFSDRKILEEIV